jgi:hypothetical protein
VREGAGGRACLNGGDVLVANDGVALEGDDELDGFFMPATNLLAACDGVFREENGEGGVEWGELK